MHGGGSARPACELVMVGATTFSLKGGSCGGHRDVLFAARLITMFVTVTFAKQELEATELEEPNPTEAWACDLQAGGDSQHLQSGGDAKR